jgi:hypothetical protein
VEEFFLFFGQMILTFTTNARRSKIGLTTCGKPPNLGLDVHDFISFYGAA